MRHLVYYVAVSADGFIADASGDPSSIPTHPDTLAALFDLYPETCPVQARAALGVNGPNRRFDTVVMGCRTYAPAAELGLPGGAYPHLRQVVATHRDLPSPVETVSGDVRAAVARLKEEPGADIWLCGGADLAGQLLDEIDEFQFKVNPVLLGAGISPVSGEGVRKLTLESTQLLPAGVVLNTYRR